jgi:hypothetical protein
MVSQLVYYSEWIIAPLLLLIYAWARFNTPPTNRSGTTCVLFYFGGVFYYALLVALCLLAPKLQGHPLFPLGRRSGTRGRADRAAEKGRSPSRPSRSRLLTNAIGATILGVAFGADRSHRPRYKWEWGGKQRHQILVASHSGIRA